MKVDRNPTQNLVRVRRCVGEIGKGLKTSWQFLWLSRLICEIDREYIHPRDKSNWKLSPDKKCPTEWWELILWWKNTLGTNIPGAWCCVAAMLSPRSSHRCHSQLLQLLGHCSCIGRCPDSQPVELSALTKAMTQFGGRTRSTNPPSYSLLFFFFREWDSRQGVLWSLRSVGR